MSLSSFKKKLASAPDSIEFSETIALIDDIYHFEPTEFTNGRLTNKAGQNSGSCKLFAFAKLQNFTYNQTLACFGAYYRHEVIEQPDADNHQNIRNFIHTGWEGIHFFTQPLQKKT